jgi:uncharacterized protein (DUF362 family)
MSDLSRRDFLTAGVALATAPLYSPTLPEGGPRSSFAMPGPFRGRVVEVGHTESVRHGQVNQTAIRRMMARGMQELTGAKEEGAAWARFFKPKDVVGVKVCTVGRPKAISHPETVVEVIRGLNLAGVPNERIIVFNRYQDEVMDLGFEKALPKGVRMAFASPGYDDVQTALDGYDPKYYVEFPRVMPGQDKDNPVNRRSHLCTIVSSQLDKIVNVCALKDHSTGGVTIALKNMSHGFVNNVCRTHPESSVNWCGTFIPNIVAMPKIRQKVVLHICDGLIGTYDGGPGEFNKHFRTWEHRALFFATDPVAMDRIGWQILDRVRVEHNLPKLAESGRKRKNPHKTEPFDYRQPEHVLTAGKMGLGEADLAKIVHKKFLIRG